MFGFVKNWLHKSEGEAKAVPPAGQSKAVGSPAGAGGGRAGATATAGAARANDKADVIELPLAAIFSRLPSDLQGRVKLPVSGQASVAIPLGVIIPQLARGAVKISFGELRQMAGDLFYSQSDRDQAIVELPLAEILSRVSPAQLPRRNKSAVEVPAEITSPFAEKGQGLNIYKPEVPPARPFARQSEEAAMPPDFLAQGTAAPAAPAVVPETRPAMPTTIPAPATLHRAAPAPTIAAAPKITPIASASTPLPSITPKPQAVTQQPPEPATTGPTVAVVLAELSAAWPSGVRTEIDAAKLSGAVVALPMAIIEEALKKGRAMFAWRQVRSWINSPAARTASPQDAELLELPLKVIAPLFMAQVRGARSGRKVAAVDENIPDLFSGPAQAKPAPAAPPVNIAPPPPTPVASPAAPIVFNDAETGKARSGDNARSGTEFLRRYATPNDIVAKAASFEGVSGALITLADGLLVASHLPPNVNGDSLAAFTPQLYARVSQSAREYRMGELKDLSFTVGGTSWKIFKVGSIFFAVFGNANETLPAAKLAGLAADLDRKSKPQA